MDASIEGELIRMFKAGLPVDSIAEELEVSISTVRNVLKRHGLTKDDIKPTQAVSQAAADYTNGISIPEILKKHNLTYSKLYGLLNRMDIPLRKSENNNAHALALQKAIEMYQAGSPLWKIVEETNIAQPSLHAELHKQNIPLRRPRK
jgi:transposase-like protein